MGMVRLTNIGPKAMNQDEPNKKIDLDMENAGAALTRAAKRARRAAAQNGTEFVVVRDGKIVREIPKLQELDDECSPTSRP